MTTTTSEQAKKLGLSFKEPSMKHRGMSARQAKVFDLLETDRWTKTSEIANVLFGDNHTTKDRTWCASILHTLRTRKGLVLSRELQHRNGPGGLEFEHIALARPRKNPQKHVRGTVGTVSVSSARGRNRKIVSGVNGEISNDKAFSRALKAMKRAEDARNKLNDAMGELMDALSDMRRDGEALSKMRRFLDQLEG